MALTGKNRIEKYKAKSRLTNMDNWMFIVNTNESQLTD